MHARILSVTFLDRIKHGGVVNVDGGCATPAVLCLIVYQQSRHFMRDENLLDIDMRVG